MSCSIVRHPDKEEGLYLKFSEVVDLEEVDISKVDILLHLMDESRLILVEMGSSYRCRTTENLTRNDRESVEIVFDVILLERGREFTL